MKNILFYYFIQLKIISSRQNIKNIYKLQGFFDDVGIVEILFGYYKDLQMKYNEYLRIIENYLNVKIKNCKQFLSNKHFKVLRFEV